MQSHGAAGYGEATEPLPNEGLAIPSVKGSDGKNVGVTGVCGYPTLTGKVGLVSIRSKYGESSAIVNCDGQMGMSSIAPLPRLRGLSQTPGGPDIKQTCMADCQKLYTPENKRRAYVFFHRIS